MVAGNSSATHSLAWIVIIQNMFGSPAPFLQAYLEIEQAEAEAKAFSVNALVAAVSARMYKVHKP